MKTSFYLLLSCALLWGAAADSAALGAAENSALPALANKQGGAKNRLLHKHQKDHEGEKTPESGENTSALA